MFGKDITERAVELSYAPVLRKHNRHNRRSKLEKRERMVATALAAIPLIGFAIFSLIPLLFAIAMAFLDITGWDVWNAVLAGNHGFANFIYVLTDPMFWESVVNTLFLGTSTLFSLVFSVIIAYLLSKEITGKKVMRIIYLMPSVCSVVAITLMWQYMFNAQSGIINQMLGKTGDNAIDWLGNSDYFSWAVIVISVWSGMGYNILLYSAAFTNIEQSSVEAAKLDGAGPFCIFFRIILPAVSPTSFYLLVTGVIGALQAFTVTNILSSYGGPNNDGVTIVFYMYQRIFNGNNMMGIASACACVLAIMILVITLIQFVLSKRWVKYDN